MRIPWNGPVRPARSRSAAARGPAPERRASAAFLLIECIVYFAVFSIVLGVAYAAFYECRELSLGLHRNADDILRAVNVGERWRQDIRSVTGGIPFQTDADGQVLHLPGNRGEITYRYIGGQVQRRGSPDAPWATVLPHVTSSKMVPDPRQFVSAWRWELELAPARKNGRVRPVFTFEAVPATPPTP